MNTEKHRRERAAGQVLVLMVGGLIAVIALVALIVDGGNAWAQRRIVQNGADAAAQAGAIVMAQRFAGVTAPAGGWDAQVLATITASAAANNIEIGGAYYTDICGIPLRSDGSAALGGGVEDLATAVAVGSGALPADSNTTPDCPSSQVGPPAGVLVFGAKSVQTYFAPVVGITAIPVTTRAAAVSGYLQGYCDASQGDWCGVIPVTIPVNAVTCDGQNRPLDTGEQWALDVVYKVPLCQSDPGSVGWLDWTPTAGGTSELIQSINPPGNNPAIVLPSWQYVTATGNINSLGVETALRQYDGVPVLVPQFDLTCNPGPNQSPNSTDPAINTAPNYGCPAGALGGNGQNQWYRMPSFAYFQFCSINDPDCAAVGASHGAYINGNNRNVCDTGNGATACLVGKFVRILATGTVGPGVGGGQGDNKVVGIQLIK